MQIAKCKMKNKRLTAESAEDAEKRAKRRFRVRLRLREAVRVLPHLVLPQPQP
jgi:hypothetical protein